VPSVNSGFFVSDCQPSWPKAFRFDPELSLSSDSFYHFLTGFSSKNVSIPCNLLPLLCIYATKMGDFLKCSNTERCKWLAAMLLGISVILVNFLLKSISPVILRTAFEFISGL
jgi:hypothetical protein